MCLRNFYWHFCLVLILASVCFTQGVGAQEIFVQDSDGETETPVQEEDQASVVGGEAKSTSQGDSDQVVVTEDVIDSGPALVNGVDSELLIGTIERPPFMMVEDGVLTGFSVDLWRAIASEMGVESSFEQYEVFSEMTEAVETARTDGAIANISITSKREIVMDYSQPIYDSGLQVVVPEVKKELSLVTLLWESGILKFISFAIVVLLVIAHILWFFERNVSDKRHDYFRDDYFGGVWDAFWWAFIIMTMGGFEKEVPHKVVSRLLAMFWIISSLFFISTLTAKITTALTVSELQSDISSYKDLVGKRVGIPESPVARDFLRGEGLTAKEYKTLPELKLAVESGEVDAIVHDAPIMQFYAAHDGLGKVLLAGDVFQADQYGILFPEDSPLKEQVDRILIKMKEDGRYDEIRSRYFGQ